VTPAYKLGDVFTFDYPFVSFEYTEMDDEGYTTALSWKPGVEFADKANGDVDVVAHGMGKQSVTIVGLYKPEGFRLRVFYTRQWTSPSGKQFGSRKLCIKGVAAFTNLIGGYRHRFTLRNPDIPMEKLRKESEGL